VKLEKWLVNAPGQGQLTLLKPTGLLRAIKGGQAQNP